VTKKEKVAMKTKGTEITTEEEKIGANPVRKEAG